MNILVVLGMHRSGTSALTGVLGHLGFTAGKSLMAANESNVRGYFEDARINSLLELLLTKLGSSWHDQRLLPENWQITDAAHVAARDLKNLFHEEFDSGQPIVFKDPRVCRLLPLLKDVWKTMGWVPQYIFSLRAPYAVVHSLSRRDGMSSLAAVLLYLNYFLEAELCTRGESRVFVQFDKLLVDWRGVIRHIAPILSIDMNWLEDSLTKHGNSIDEYLSPELNHYPAERDLPTGLAMNLALQLHALLSGPIDDQLLAKIDSLRKRWLLYLQDINPWLDEVASINRYSAESSQLQLSKSNHYLHWMNPQGRSEIYYSSVNETFGEGRNISERWAFGRVTEQRFVFPELRSPVDQLRWDITDRPAFCKVQKVWIEDVSGQIQWTYPRGLNLFGEVSPDMHLLNCNASGELMIFSSGTDPFGLLNLPSNLLHAIKSGWSFCTVIQVELPMFALTELGQGFAIFRQQIRNGLSELTAATTERDELRRSAASDSARLQELEKKMASLHLDLKRAEVQLDLLKKLCLTDSLDVCTRKCRDE